jgi:hypothetical protein
VSIRRDHNCDLTKYIVNFITLRVEINNTKLIDHSVLIKIFFILI